MTTPAPSNISRAGRRARLRFGWGLVAVCVGLAAALARLDVHWLWRTLVFFPVAGAATCFLEVRRQTCVWRAAEGSCELDDGTKRPASADEASASRAVARTIYRDAVLLGLAGAALAMAAAFA